MGIVKLIDSLFNVCDLVAHFSYDMSVKAVCVLLGETVKGVLHFEQQGAEAVQIKGEVTGLTAGNHGFHVHEFGDYSNGCMSAGGHFNPANQQHGCPTASVRHVGDLETLLLLIQELLLLTLTTALFSFLEKTVLLDVLL